MGHNAVWMSIANNIGCIAERTNKTAIMPKGRFRYKCIHCTKLYTFHKRLTPNNACAECCQKYNNGKFSNLYSLVRV